MKFAQRTALVCSITASFLLAVACGSNDSSGLFSTGGVGANNSGGSFANGGSSAHAGQANGGSNSNRGGSVGNTSGGQANGGGNSAGGTSSGGSNQAGTGAGGASGGMVGMGGGALGGSAGSEAAGSGGTTANTGGTGAGGSGAGGTGAGAGGMSGGGAGGAVGGSGGSGGLNGCPPNVPPQDGAVCIIPTPDSCYYPGEACSCLQDQQGPGRHWGCYGTPDKCPTGAAPHPTDGASCKGYSGGLCPYSATDFCACIPALGGGGEPKWGCNQSDACPAMRPQNAFCSTVRECTYGDRACFCSGTVWGCE